MHPDELRPSYVVENERVYRGCVYDDDDNVLFTCKHLHTKPEYNVRYEPIPGKKRVWEFSALNCAKSAASQLEVNQRPIGLHGPVDDDSIALRHRPDFRQVLIDDRSFTGSVYLTQAGKRILTATGDAEDVEAHLNLDITPHKGLTIPSNSIYAEGDLKTVLYLLSGTVWGYIFQDQEPLTADDVLDEAIEMFEPRTRKPGRKEGRKEAKPSKKSYRLNISVDGSKRAYIIVDQDDNEIETFYQRGRAVARMKELA